MRFRAVLSVPLLSLIAVSGVEGVNAYDRALVAAIAPHQPIPSIDSNLRLSSQVARRASPEPLDLQAQHPNGTVVRLISIARLRKYTILDLSITNDFRAVPIQLNGGFPNLKGMILQDDLGYQYRLITPKYNPTVLIPPSQTLTGKFVFAGKIPRKARSLTLITNFDAGKVNGQQTTVPKMMISGIPIQRR
jgi:hypothetical protein